MIFISVLFLHFCVHLYGLPAVNQRQKVGHSYNGKGLAIGLQSLISIEQQLGNVGKGISCSLCKILAGFLHYYINLETTDDEIVKILTKVCIDLKIEDKRVCVAVIREFKDEVLTVFDKAVVTPDDICGTILGPSCADAGSAYGPWNVTFPKATRDRRGTTGKEPKRHRVCRYRMLGRSVLRLTMLYSL